MIAILTGGTSSEREIALQSAQTVKGALESDYDVRVYDLPQDLDRFLRERKEIAVAVPVFHGRGGEDGTIQGFLKTLGIPFLFSNVEACAVGMNKALTKALMARTSVRTPEDRVVRDGEQVVFECPVVVKPIDGGSTIGMSVVKEPMQLNRALEIAFQHADQVLVEQYIEGDEYTVGVIDEAGRSVALPVIAIRAKGGFFDFESKYKAGAMAEEICPAPIPDDLARRLQSSAVTAHRAVGARHLSRSDFIVDRTGTIWFLEINMIPGLTQNSLIPKSLRASGRDLGGVFHGWIEDCLK